MLSLVRCGSGSTRSAREHVRQVIEHVLHGKGGKNCLPDPLLHFNVGIRMLILIRHQLQQRLHIQIRQPFSESQVMPRSGQECLWRLISCPRLLDAFGRIEEVLGE